MSNVILAFPTTMKDKTSETAWHAEGIQTYFKVLGTSDYSSKALQ